MKELFKGFLSNVLVAMLAAVMAIMQEVWIGTELRFWNVFILGACAGIALSFCVEICKQVCMEHKWSWDDVVTGAITGVFVALIGALACVL